MTNRQWSSVIANRPLPIEVEKRRPRSAGLLGGAFANLIGFGVPLVVAVVALPYVLKEMGAERFGLFSIILSALGVMSLFDLGLPRASIKFAAEALAKRDTAGFARVYWTTLVLNVGLGLFGTVSVWLLAPWLTQTILRTPPRLYEEAVWSLRLAAISLVPIMVAGACRGTLEAGLHFNASNLLRIPASIALYLVPVLLLPFGAGLIPIFAVILLVRVSLAITHVATCMHLYAGPRPVTFSSHVARQLASFGAWVLCGNVAATLMTAIDRFVLAGIRGLSSVPYYAAPMDVLTKLLVVPTSIATALFPRLSMHDGGSGQTAVLCDKSMRVVLITLGPVVALTLLVARPGLTWWLGREFADQSTHVFQIIAVGILIGALGWVPYAALQALGRPEVVSAFLMGEIPVIYLALRWAIESRGIEGAAWVFLFRMVAEVAFFLFALHWLEPALGIGRWSRELTLALLGVVGLCGVAVFASASRSPSATWPAWLSTITLIAWLLTAWRLILREDERRVVMALGRAWLGQKKAILRKR